MTLIISAEEEGCVIMGADSAASSPNEVYTFPALEKIVQCGEYLIGACGSGRVCQIIRTLVEWPEVPETDVLMPFLVRKVAPAIRDAVEEAGALQEGLSGLGNKTQIVLGIKGQLFYIATDLAIVKSHSMGCIGSGRHHGYAAMHALAAVGVGPARKRIQLALEAAAEYSLQVRPPFRFLESPSIPLPTQLTSVP